MLEELENIYTILGYEDIFSIKNKKARVFEIAKAHVKLLDLLFRCRDLGIISSVNEDKLNEIEDS